MRTDEEEGEERAAPFLADGADFTGPMHAQRSLGFLGERAPELCGEKEGKSGIVRAFTEQHFYP